MPGEGHLCARDGPMSRTERVDGAILRADHAPMGPDGGPDVPRRWARWVVLGVAVTALSACSSSDPADRDAAAEPDVTSTAPDGTGTADGATSAVPDGATSADDVGDVT